MRGVNGSDLYIFQMAETGDVKVGRSKNVSQRIKQLQTGCPHKLRLILHAPGEGHRERALHRAMRYRGTRRDGEWFEEGALAELPADLYERLLHMDDQDWWRPREISPTTKKAPPPKPTEPDWFDSLRERGLLE